MNMCLYAYLFRCLNILKLVFMFLKCLIITNFQATDKEFQLILTRGLKVDSVEPENKKSLLLFLLENGRKDLARVIISLVDVKNVLTDCDVSVGSLEGKKNALHYVTEYGDVDFAREILNKVTLTSHE